MSYTVMKVELPPDANPNDLEAARAELERTIAAGGVQAEVDVEDVSRSLGGINPAMIVSILATGAAMAAHFDTIGKALKTWKELAKSSGGSDLTPAQKLLAQLDLDKIFVKVDGKDVPLKSLLSEKES